MFGTAKPKPTKIESLLIKPRKAWNEKLSSFEKIVSYFIFGQILSLLYDLLGIRRMVKFNNPFLKELESKSDAKWPISFIDFDSQTNHIKGNSNLVKFQTSINQKTDLASSNS